MQSPDLGYSRLPRNVTNHGLLINNVSYVVMSACSYTPIVIKSYDFLYL